MFKYSKQSKVIRKPAESTEPESSLTKRGTTWQTLTGNIQVCNI